MRKQVITFSGGHPLAQDFGGARRERDLPARRLRPSMRIENITLPQMHVLGLDPVDQFHNFTFAISPASSPRASPGCWCRYLISRSGPVSRYNRKDEAEYGRPDRCSAPRHPDDIYDPHVLRKVKEIFSKANQTTHSDNEEYG